MEQKIKMQDSTITELNNKTDKQRKALNKIKDDLVNVSKQHSVLTELHQNDTSSIGSTITEIMDYHVGKYIYKFY